MEPGRDRIDMSVGLALPRSLWPTVHRLATGAAWPPASPEAADRLVARAIREGLQPLLFADAEQPAVVLDALSRVRALDRLSARRAAILLSAAQQLDRILQDEPFVFLKGIDYAHRLYPSPALRPMQDVDILVPRERMAMACRALESRGLRRVPTAAVAELPSHHEQLFRLGEVSVDVHHSFVQRARNRIDYEGVWSRRVPLDAPPLTACRLADADALVYHALAMAVDEFSIPLLRYVDLWLMLRGDRGALCEAAAARARSWGVERALYGALRSALRVFPELRDSPVAAMIGRLLRPSIRRFMDRCVLPDPWEHGDGRPAGRPTRLWRKLWLMDGMRYRIAFASYHSYALARSALAGTGSGKVSVRGISDP
jgi:hypothetical protein